MKYLVPFLMMFLILGTFIFANIYLARRFNFYFDLDSIWLLYIGFGLTTLFMLFGGMPSTNSVGLAGHIINVLSFTLLGFFLYLLLSTLVVDFIGLLTPIKAMSKGILAIGLASTISIYGILNANYTRITNRSVEIPGLMKPVKAMHLTDTHLGHFRGAKTISRLVDRINKEEVDIIFFTGDLLDGLIQLKEESLKHLADFNAPVYFVEGNHDVYTGVDAIKDYLRGIGVNVLTNEVVAWNDIQIMGLNHMIADSAGFDMHAQPGKLTIKSALETLVYDPDKPLILLHHSPTGVKYAAEKGVNLYLAGHTHGGQMFPATFIAKAIFEYNSGLHKLGNTYINVSEGTGTFGPPMRVGTKSEMTLINLIPN